MKIKSVKWQKITRQFASPLKLAHGELTYRDSIVIALTTDNRVIGYGEAAPLAGFSTESLDDVTAETDHFDSSSSGRELPESPFELLSELPRVFPVVSPSLKFAVETAALDALAKTKGQPLFRLLNKFADRDVPVNLILTEPMGMSPAEAKRLVFDGYRSIKIKIRGTELDPDWLEIINENVSHKCTIRLDANRQWSPDDARKILRAFEGLKIEYVEEPLMQPSPETLHRLFEDTGIPIALDETLVGLRDIEPYLRMSGIAALILKPTILGGISSVLPLIERGRECGKNIILTSAFETEVGHAVLLHLAAVFGADVPCGLDTLRFFDNTARWMTKVNKGCIELPSENGIGFEPVDFLSD